MAASVINYLSKDQLKVRVLLYGKLLSLFFFDNVIGAAIPVVAAGGIYLDKGLNEKL